MSELPAAASRHLADTAVCCSGGGIRSATYCLGAMQALAAGGMRRVDLVTAVSGGSYIAAAWALQAQSAVQQPGSRHPADGAPDGRAADAAVSSAQQPGYRAAYQKAFRPGSAEESRLRDHTHYLVPNAAQGLHGILSLIWGAVGNLLLVTSLSYLLLSLDGWLLRATGGVHWSAQDGGLEPQLTITPLQIWTPAGLGIAAVLLFAASRLPLARRILPGSAGTVGDRLALWTTMLLGLAAATALLLIGGPALFASAWNVHWVATNMGGAPNIGDTAATLSLYAVGLATIAKGAAGNVSAYWSRLGKGGQGVIRPWLARAGRLVLPWLGSALIVIGLIAWGVYALGVSTRPGFQHWHLAVAAAIFAALHVALDVNRTSMHDFYRDRLASGYADGAVSATRLSQLRHATPALTVCAAANLNSGTVRSARPGARPLQRGVPPGRGAVAWMFTPSSTGLHFPNVGSGDELVCTAAYEILLGADRMTLFDIVADSGAAISPLMGKATSAAHRLLLAAVNIRLGVWLPRPALVKLISDRAEAADRASGRSAWAAALGMLELRGPVARWWLSSQLAAWEKVYRQHSSKLAGDRPGRGSSVAAALRWRIWQPNLVLLWREAVGRNPVGHKWIYVTDGGHYDNLGLVEALRGNPRRIYVLDASSDPDHCYRALGQAIALARSELGVEIQIDPLAMELPAGGTPAGLRQPQLCQPHAWGQFRYTAGPRAGQRGTIGMIKLGVWAGEDLPWDARAYYQAQRTFPRSSTLQQLYDDEGLRGLPRARCRVHAGSARRPTPAPPRQPASAEPRQGRSGRRRPTRPARHRQARAARRREARAAAPRRRRSRPSRAAALTTGRQPAGPAPPGGIRRRGRHLSVGCLHGSVRSDDGQRPELR